MESLDFKNKRILITQNALHFLAGSEITTLELATFFQQKGAEVIIFTWLLSDPMQKEFKKRNLNITTDENDKRFDNIDIAWIHHQVIPKRLLKSLESPKHNTRFYFFHMSPLDILPIERPYLCNLESKIAEKSLFSSQGTKDSLVQLFPSLKPKAYILENILPDEFCIQRDSNPIIRKILIVSNHPPEELKSAMSTLSKRNIHIDFIGKGGKTELISAKILAQYDLVISIGKTVIYCLGANIPIYVYDHFGGPGFLTKSNFEKSRYYTFSGRGFKKKSSQKIIDEIQDSYPKAVTYQKQNLAYFRDEFSLEKQITNILKDQPRKNLQSQKITEGQFNTLVSILNLVKAKVETENNLSDFKVYYDTQISSLKQNLQQITNQYNQIINSKKFKLLSKLSEIAHPIKSKT